MKNTTRFVVPSTLFLLAGAQSLSAAVIAKDDFNSYTAGALSPQNGGSNWSGGWTAALSGTNTTTSATVVDAAGDKKVTAARGGTAASSAGTVAGGRALATSLTSTFYVSYQVAYTGSGAFGGNNTFGLVVSDLTVPSNTVASNVLNFGMRSSANAGDPSMTEFFSVRGGTGSLTANTQTTGTVPIAAGTTYTLLAKLTWSGTDFDQIDMWVNPTGSVEPVGSDASFSLGATAGVAAINSLYFRQAANETTDTYQFDNLIVASTWAEAIPEPGCAALLGIGVFTFLGFRRRSRR